MANIHPDLSQALTPREPHNGWHGYTFDELRLRRAYVQVKLDLARENIVETLDAMRKGRFAKGAEVKKGIMGKMMGALNYLDYAYLAYLAGSRLLRLRRHGKKS